MHSLQHLPVHYGSYFFRRSCKSFKANWLRFELTSAKRRFIVRNIFILRTLNYHWQNKKKITEKIHRVFLGVIVFNKFGATHQWIRWIWPTKDIFLNIIDQIWRICIIFGTITTKKMHNLRIGTSQYSPNLVNLSGANLKIMSFGRKSLGGDAPSKIRRKTNSV